MVSIEKAAQISNHPDPREIEESRVYTPSEKADFYQRYLERERRTGLKNLIAESENWPPNLRRALDEALAKTPLALGFATRLSSTDDQVRFLNRMLALGYNDNGVTEAFVDIASTATLNNIALRLKDLSHLGKRGKGDNLGSGMYFMKRLAERVGEMCLDSQKMFAKSVIDFDIFENDLGRNEAFKRQLYQTMFEKMSPDARNAVLDELQKADGWIENYFPNH